MATRTSVTRTTSGLRKPVSFPESAEFEADLKTSVFPRFGTGAISYSRASVATFTDYEGIIREVLSGEARFEGARRVQNLFTDSEFITGIAGIPKKTAGIINSSLTGFKSAINFTATGSLEYAYRTNFTTVSGNTYIISAFIKMDDNSVPRGGLFSNDANADIVGVIGGATATSYLGYTSVGNNIYRLSWKRIASSTSNDNGIVRYAGNSGKAFTVSGYELEDVTGQSTQTVGEYVSTNVLSFPFHGACVDGVKYFDTDLNGAPIPKSTLKGYFSEGTRTNICPYSDFAVAGWGLNFLTRVNNAGIAPDGTNSFVKIIPNAGTQSSYAYNVNITTTAQVYTLSCYVKADGLNFVQLRFGAGISSGYANFDLLNGVVGTISLWTSSGIEPVSAFPGVYRIWAVTNTVLAATAAIAIQIVPAADSIAGAPVTGNGVSWVMTWGMQIELGPSVSSYIPTTTTTVTRNIDVLTYDVKNVIANQGAFSVVSTMNDNEIFDRRVLNLSSFTVNRLHVQARTLGIPNAAIVYGDGVTVRSVIGVAAGTNNIAVAWTNGVGLNLYMNNIKYISTFVPSLAFTIIDVGGGVLGYPLFGCVRDLRIWKTRPTDAELLLLSNNP